MTQSSSEEVRKAIGNLKSTRQDRDQSLHRRQFLHRLQTEILDRKIPAVLRNSNKLFDQYDIVVIDGLNVLRSYQKQIRAAHPFTNQRFYEIMNESWDRVHPSVRGMFSGFPALFIWVLPGAETGLRFEKKSDMEYILRCPLTTDHERRDDDAAVLATAMFLSHKKQLGQEMQASKSALAAQFLAHQQKIRSKTFLDDATLGLVNRFSKIDRLLKRDIFSHIHRIIVASRDKYRDWAASMGGVHFASV
jgi:hypothetical protein